MPAATDMSRQPYDSGSGVSEEQRVIRSEIAERFGQEFRTYGLDLGTFINVVLQKTVEGIRFRDVLFEEAPIDFFLHALEERNHSGLDIANKAKINGRGAPNMLRVLVNLDFFHLVAGEELREWKICAEHQQEFGLVDCAIGSAVTDQACHANRVGIVVLQPLLAAEGIPDSRFLSLRAFSHLI